MPSWDITPDITLHIETVHRLSNRGAVLTHTANATSQEGLNAEWRVITLVGVSGDRINRSEIFDETDLDAALARFDELHLTKPQPRNAASQVNDRFDACFAASDWDGMAQLLTDDTMTDDRRRVVNAGMRRGRDAEIASMRVIAELGIVSAKSVVIATRGRNLALLRTHFAGDDQSPGAFQGDIVDIIEIATDDRIVARVAFDHDDIDAAFEELDARYLRGEAVDHAHTWSVIANAYAALNRHELPATTPDWVNIDHRLLATVEPGEMTANIRAAWDLFADVSWHIEAVHRLTDLGAVITHVSPGTSQEGFEAEVQQNAILTVDGDLIDRCEIFNEEDLDAAIAKFDELSRPAPRLENAASQVDARFNACFAARDWDAMAEMLTDDFSNNDRRRTVNAGIRHGRDAETVNLRALVDLGVKYLTSVVVATRGGRLALTRTRLTGGEERTGAFEAEVLQIVEIDADERYAAVVVFDDDEIDAAFEELDARYLAGEAAPYAQTYSLIAEGYAAVNRGELLATTAEIIDHRQLAPVESVDVNAYIRATYDLTRDIDVYIEAVHRLTDLGGLVTHVGTGTTQEGSDAEWRVVDVYSIEDGQINRCEMFDEADFDAALACFEELRPQERRLENTATRMYVRFNAYLAARDWDAMAEMISDDVSDDDRRRVVSGGVRRGRDAQIANLRAIVDVGVRNLESVVIATRGDRLALTRTRVSGGDKGPEAFGLEMLTVIEIDTDSRIRAGVSFDLDDFDAAIAELDARYLRGEAVDHAHTWSVIANAYAALNRHELPATTPDWVNIDHRCGPSFAPGEMTAYLRTGFDFAPNRFIQAVHRLSNLGTVVTRVANGTSEEGFDAEWRAIDLLTVEGDLISRGEIFDEADIDTAVTRFDELSRPAPLLERRDPDLGASR